MPTWAQAIVSVAVVITALGVLWAKLLKPIFKFSTAAQQMLPVMQEMTTAFHDAPGALKVLNEIAKQFRTDSGSSLRDVVNRIEEAADKNQTAASKLAVESETSRQLAALDREKLQELLLAFDRQSVREDTAVKSRDRLEEHTKGIADDLVASHERADAIQDGESGDAADAAQQTEPTTN